MSKTKETWYWACEACGASPIPAINRWRWFSTEQEAIDAGKPATCSNRLCHGLDRDSQALTDKIKVHKI